MLDPAPAHSVPAHLECLEHERLLPVRAVISRVGPGQQYSGLMICHADEDGVAGKPPQIICLVLIGDHLTFDTVESRYQVKVKIQYSTGNSVFTLLFANGLNYMSFVESFTAVKLEIVTRRAEAIDRLKVIVDVVPQAPTDMLSPSIPVHCQSIDWTSRTAIHREAPPSRHQYRTTETGVQTDILRCETPPAYPGRPSASSEAQGDVSAYALPSFGHALRTDETKKRGNASPPAAKRLRGLFGNSIPSSAASRGLFATPPPRFAALPATRTAPAIPAEAPPLTQQSLGAFGGALAASGVEQRSGVLGLWGPAEVSDSAGMSDVTMDSFGLEYA